MRKALLSAVVLYNTRPVIFQTAQQHQVWHEKFTQTFRSSLSQVFQRDANKVQIFILPEFGDYDINYSILQIYGERVRV